jgi:hypothetical protein
MSIDSSLVCSPLSTLRPFTSGTSGLPRWHLARMVSEGTIRRVLRDVYCPAEVPDRLELRARAAALVMPPHAVLVDRTAAWLWGVDVLDPDERDTVPRLEVFVLPGHKRVARREASGGERTLLARDVVELLGVRVTSPVRTALDLACRRGRYQALAAMDGLARCQGITVGELTSELPRFRGRRGVVQARRLVPLMDARAESSGESFTRLAIVESGLPVPTPQHWVGQAGVLIFRLDLAYPRLKICIEYDGQEHHTSPEDRASDRRRRTWLEERGWIVIVVDKDSFRPGALDQWLTDLRRAIAARTH